MCGVPFAAAGPPTSKQGDCPHLACSYCIHERPDCLKGVTHNTQVIYQTPFCPFCPEAAHTPNQTAYTTQLMHGWATAWALPS